MNVYNIRMSAGQLMRIREALAHMPSNEERGIVDSNDDSILAPTDPSELVALCDMTLADVEPDREAINSWIA